MFELFQPLYNVEGEIGAASESVEVAEETVNPGSAEEAERPESESSFARRLREHSEKVLRSEREKWEKEVQEKYGDYDTHRELSTYFQQVNGMDAMTLKERIEMERLQERADTNNISPDMQRRLEVLEQKAAKADELEQQQQQGQWESTYWSNVNEFVKDRGVDAQELNQFMVDNELLVDPNNLEKSLSIAFNAMRAEQLEQKLASAKESAVKEYLQSKSAPRVEGSGTPGIVQEDTSKMDWKDIRQRTLARINAANQST